MSKPAPSPYPISIAELRVRYLRLYSGAINDVLRFKFHRYDTCLPPEFTPLEPGLKLVGQAFCVKGAPDLLSDHEFERRAEMLEALHEDCVVVWDCTGDRVTAQWGEVMTLAAQQLGCRGAVVNGVRDTAAILALGFPVFCQYRTSAGMLGRFRLYHWQQPILVGAVVIQPGDWVFGDLDGVIVVPQDLAFEVLVEAEKIVYQEQTVRDLIEQGHRPTEVVRRGGYF